MRKGAGAILLGVLSWLPVNAGTLTTTPVRIDLAGHRSTGTLTVVNRGMTRSIIQIDPVAWRQEQGEERYAPTEDLLALPALFELGPGEEQLVRVGLRRPPGTGAERAYRIYLSEIPDQSLPEKEAVHVLLRIGIPVFVHAQPRVSPALRWRASCRRGTFRLQAANGGNGHARIVALAVRDRAGKKPFAETDDAGYILAGAERLWEMEVPKCPPAGSPVALSVTTEEGLLSEQVTLEE